MKRKSGIILGIALIMFLVISIIGAALITIVMGRAKQTNDLEKRTQAYFFAKSGVEIAREYANQKEKDDQQFLEGKVFVLYGNLHDEGTSFEFYRQDVTNTWSSGIRESFEASSSSFKDYDIVTAIWKDGNITNFLSAGNAGDMCRMLAFQYRRASISGGGSIGTLPQFDMAVFARNGLSVNNGVTITGNVITNSTTPGSFYVGNGFVVGDDSGEEGKVLIGPGGNTGVKRPGTGNEPTIVNPSGVVQLSANWLWNSWKNTQIDSLSQIREYVLPQMPAFPGQPDFPDFPVFPLLVEKGDLSANVKKNPITVSEEGKYGSISISESLVVNLNGNNDFKITANSLTSSGRFIVNGPGTLNLYIENSLSSSGGFELENDAKLNLFVSGSVVISSNSKQSTNLTTLYVNGSGDVVVNDDVTVDSLYIKTFGDFKHENESINVIDKALLMATNFESKGSAKMFLNSGQLEMYIAEKLQMIAGTSINGVGHGSIYTSNLMLTNGHIRLSSGNTMNSLKIFVDEDFIMGSGSSINKDGDPKRVALYYRGTTEGNSQKVVDISGGQSFVGTLFMRPGKDPQTGEDRDDLTPKLLLAGGGNVEGTIMTSSRNVEIKGGSSAKVTAVFAPEAEVAVTQGGTVNGAIVSDTFTMSGGGKVKHISSLGDYTFPGSFDEITDPGTETEIELWGE